MIELPECVVLARQINQTLRGKRIEHAEANHSPHGFAGYNIDPAEYDGMLAGRQISSANPGTGFSCGGNTEINCEDRFLVLSTPIRYHPAGAKLPAKHQLCLTFDDGSHLTCTVKMWGALLCLPSNPDEWGDGEPPWEIAIRKTPSPLEDAFDEAYFQTLTQAIDPKLSVKAVLATGQRIPGLGNGVLQDILFRARLHPKRKFVSLSDPERFELYSAVKSTLRLMAEQGGRDTEKDLFGNPGGYRTILSKKTLDKPCPVCGGALCREAYLGGNIYFCPTCQPLEE